MADRYRPHVPRQWRRAHRADARATGDQSPFDMSIILDMLAMGPHELPPAGFADDRAIDEDRFAAHERSHHLAGEFAAKIGADPAARLEIGRGQRAACLRADDRTVRV